MRDEAGYTEYVTVRLPRLRRAAYLLCGDVHRADDIVQATLVALYRHWANARRAENTDAYVHRMLVRRFLDERRLGWARVALTGRVPDRPAPESAAAEPADIQAALRRLPPGQRAVLVLRFLCDLSVAETASALNCSEGNVKAQTARGLAALRPILGPGASIDSGR